MLPSAPTPNPPLKNWKRRLHEIIFEADTPIGKAFDMILVGAIVTSVLVVMLESVRSIREVYGGLLYGIEWFFTILFTIEYLLRLVAVGRPWKYALSFYGIIDLLAIIPTYISVLVPGAQYFLSVRMLRLLRIFRVLKMAQYISEANALTRALIASRRKISIFLYSVMIIVVVMGALMYFIEGEEHGYTSIPKSIYWAIVTLTTVGYGDISPETPLGQVVASIIMLMGYGIIAVPTGIVTAELTQQVKDVSTQSCPQCSAEGHAPNAKYCKFCGSKL